MKTYNWGVLGCGVIANELALAMKNHDKKLYGVANRTLSKDRLRTLQRSMKSKMFMTVLKI